MSQIIKAASEGKKGVQPNTSKVYLIKCPVSVLYMFVGFLNMYLIKF